MNIYRFVNCLYFFFIISCSEIGGDNGFELINEVKLGQLFSYEINLTPKEQGEFKSIFSQFEKKKHKRIYAENPGYTNNIPLFYISYQLKNEIIKIHIYNSKNNIILKSYKRDYIVIYDSSEQNKKILIEFIKKTAERHKI